MPSCWFSGLTLYNMSLNDRLARMYQASVNLIMGLWVLHSDTKTHIPNSQIQIHSNYKENRRIS
jgi:hypothetical protein